jgi:Zn-dependent peptidase ImmA (M78 family)/DNA-binding XRE family transcriptional regulator
MDNSNEIFSERFKSARNLNGLSLQDLAEKLNNKVSRQALHKYEKGEVIPDSEMIGLLSEALSVRPEFFFREVKVELGEIEFRKLKKLPAKEETRVIEQTKDYLSRYIELEEIIGIQSFFENPISSEVNMNTFEEVEAAEKKVREVWNLGSDPISNVLELLEDNHIKVIEINAGDAFDGMQTWVNGNIPVIAINRNRVKKDDRVRFTVMHELAHLLLPIKHLPEGKKETLCHQFAGAMLFPEEAIHMELGKSRHRLFVQELGPLKQQYGISMQAIVMRLKDLKVISDSYCKQFFFYLNQMNWKIDEPVEYVGVEKSNRFDQLLFRALAEEQISMSKAASLKNQKVSEFKAQSLMIG